MSDVPIDAERPADRDERDEEPEARLDDERERADEVVGLGVEADERDVPEPNEPA